MTNTARITEIQTIAPREPVFSLYLDRQVLPGKPGGISAMVELEARDLAVSKLDGETGWTIDGEFLKNGLPVFFNGTGSRCTIPRHVDEALAADLDAAAGAVA